MVDIGVLRLYEGVSERIVDLVAIDPNVQVPSCPQWSALDLLRHVCAVAEDWVEGRLDGYGTEEWTQKGVKRLSDLTLEELSQAWAVALAEMGDLGDKPGMGDPARFALGDAAVHEADLRAILAPGSVLPQEVLTVATKGSFAVWRQHLLSKGAPDLVIELGTGPVLRVGDDPQVCLRLSEYELFRMLNGRRSVSQIEEYDWSASPEPYISAGLGGPVTGGFEGVATWAELPLLEPLL
ncbi:MAG: hypothetical protein CL426_03075 [Acidimicrobiaceae bacterium]|nr:hypothetical protein [Acidimicrobiaceae bacterium]